MSTFEFAEPRKLNSANVQAEFYRQATNAGLRCILEYRHERCRFDAVIVFGDVISHIVEVKNYRRFKEKYLGSKQLQKYSEYGAPVILVRGLRDVPKAVAEIKCSLSIGRVA